MTSIETYYEIILTDIEGRIVKRTGKMPSHSYVKQFLELIYGFFGHVNKAAKDVTGATTQIVDGTSTYSVTQWGRVDAPASNDTYGIVVGTNAGETAEDNENYVLDTKILHASEVADKLNYQSVTFVAPAEVNDNIDFDIIRTFINDSGGTITVKEIGIIIKQIAPTRYHLVLRDVVTAEDVLNGYTLTVVYTLRTTV